MPILAYFSVINFVVSEKFPTFALFLMTNIRKEKKLIDKSWQEKITTRF